MKKIIIIGILAFCIQGAFSEIVEENIKAHFDMPFASEYTTRNEIQTVTQMFGIGGGVDGRTMFSSVMGIFISSVFYAPMHLQAVIADNDSVTTVSTKHSDYDTIIGMSFLLGPEIIPVRKEHFNLVISPGFHVSYLASSAAENAQSAWTFGEGANIDAEFLVNKYFNISVGAGIYTDIYGTGKVTQGGVTVSSSGWEAAFFFVPRLALGFTY